MKEYPENIQIEEPIKELLKRLYHELGIPSYYIDKEKQVSLYLPRIDVFSILKESHIQLFRGTIFENLKPVTCVEVHSSTLDISTFNKWNLEAYGIFYNFM